CSVIAQALRRCGLRISEKTVNRVYSEQRRSLTALDHTTSALLKVREWADNFYGTDAELELKRQLELSAVMVDGLENWEGEKFLFECDDGDTRARWYAE